MARPLCPFTALCGLQRSIAMEAALRVWESFYCEGAYCRCERFRLRESGRDVPARLLPNGRLVDGAGEDRPASARNDPPPLPILPPRHAA